MILLEEFRLRIISIDIYVFLLFSSLFSESQFQIQHSFDVGCECHLNTINELNPLIAALYVSLSFARSMCDATLNPFNIPAAVGLMM